MSKQQDKNEENKREERWDDKDDRNYGLKHKASLFWKGKYIVWFSFLGTYCIFIYILRA